jgi:hypothetical protein
MAHSSSKTNAHGDEMEFATERVNANDVPAFRPIGRMEGVHRGRVVDATLAHAGGGDLLGTYADYYRQKLDMIEDGNLKAHPFRTWENAAKDFAKYADERLQHQLSLFQETKDAPEWKGKVRILTIPRLYQVPKGKRCPTEVQEQVSALSCGTITEAWLKDKGYYYHTTAYTNERNNVTMFLAVALPTKEKREEELGEGGEDPE